MTRMAARWPTARIYAPRRASATFPPSPLPCARSRPCASPQRGSVELHFTYDEEFGGEVAPAGC